MHNFVKTKCYIFFLVLVLGIGTLISCSRSTTTIPKISSDHEKAIDIISKSISYHGGLKAFRNLIQLDFEKDFVLYKSDGSVEYKRVQNHKYLPKQSIYNISWKQDGKLMQNTQNRNAYTQTIDGRSNQKIKSSNIQSAIDASVFTILIPYKLLNEGADISYEGIQKLEDGTNVFVIKAAYDPSKNKNHTKSDIWWHFFNTETHRHEGYQVKLIDHTSLIRNLDFQTINGYTFPAARNSWRIDEQGNKEYLRAAYEYQIVTVR